MRGKAMMENSVYDYLTGLYNRKGLYEKYDEMSGEDNIHFMFFDLDNFKTVNDVYGHKSGDELLISTGRLLKKCVPEATAVRLGGDEFVLMLFGEKTREELTCAAEQILSEMRKKGKEMDFFTVVSMRIGIVWNASRDTGLEQLLNAARRFTDHIAERFGPEEGKWKGYPGHEIAEMALLRLYEVTEEEKYLNLGRFFIEERGKRPYYFDREHPEDIRKGTEKELRYF